MVKGDMGKVCNLVVIAAAVASVVWGFIELLRRQEQVEPTVADTISRQIRGIAFIMLGQVILVLGGMVCSGFKGGFLSGLARVVRA